MVVKSEFWPDDLNPPPGHYQIYALAIQLLTSQYNYVLSAALDVGTALSAVAIFLLLRLPNANVDWWGNTVYTNSKSVNGC
jgi:hypothetical protein